MNGRQSRRAFLAGVGSVAVAGCLDGVWGSSDTSGPEPLETISSSWPMPDADAGRSNFSPGATGPLSQPAQLWQSETDEDSLSKPVLSDGRLYCAGNSGTVFAFDARTGTQQWTTNVGTAAGTPWIHDDSLYLPVESSSPTTPSAIVALGTDGTERWRVNAPDRAGFLVADHGIYYLREAATPTAVALSHDGSERWTRELSEIYLPLLFASDDILFISTGHNWDTPWVFDPQSGEFRGENRPEPPAPEDMMTELCCYDGTLYKADIIFGEVATMAVTDDGLSEGWTNRPDDLEPGGRHLAVNETQVFAYDAQENTFVALSGPSGIDWTVDSIPVENADPPQRPVVGSETVLFPSRHNLLCFDPETGETLWELPAETIGREPIVADDMLFTTDGDTVRALR